MGASALSHQDILDLQQIAQHLPTGDPRQAKVSTLLNSEPTEFEQSRNSDNREGFLKGAWNTVKGIPGGIASAMYDPQMAAVDTALKIEDNDAHRKDEGRSGAYRGIAGVGDALGIDSRGMEDAADRGDTSGVLGHAAGSAAPYVAPLAAEGIGRGIGAAARPVGRGMVSAANVIDPDLVGLASPRLAHAQRLVSRTGNALGKLGKPAPVAGIDALSEAASAPRIDALSEEASQPAPSTRGVPDIEESDIEEARRRGMPREGSYEPEPARYALGPGQVPPDVVGQPNPNVLAGNQGIIVRKPLALPPARLARPMSADAIDDMGVNQEMMQRANAEDRGDINADWNENKNAAVPKWKQVAQIRAQLAAEAVMKEAEAAQAIPARLTRTPKPSARAQLGKPQPELSATPDDQLLPQLEESVRMARAKKQQK